MVRVRFQTIEWTGSTVRECLSQVLDKDKVLKVQQRKVVRGMTIAIQWTYTRKRQIDSYRQIDEVKKLDIQLSQTDRQIVLLSLVFCLPISAYGHRSRDYFPQTLRSVWWFVPRGWDYSIVTAPSAPPTTAVIINTQSFLSPPSLPAALMGQTFCGGSIAAARLLNRQLPHGMSRYQNAIQGLSHRV